MDLFDNEKNGLDATGKFVLQESYENSEDYYIDDDTLIEKGTELRLVTGVVLEPETTDLQGDIYSAEEVRKTAHKFLSDYQGQGNGREHKTMGDPGLRIVESYIAPAEIKINKANIKKGTWLMSTIVLDDKIWKSVKSGEITGYSIRGTSNAKLEAEV